MADKTRYADHIKEWEGLAASLTANAAEVPHLEMRRAALQKLLEEIRSLTTQQAAFQSQKQQVSQKIKILIKEGIRLATVVRFSLKQHYGIRNEKLVEYGLQPFRGIVRKKEPAVEPPGTPEPSPNPASPAAE